MSVEPSAGFPAYEPVERPEPPKKDQRVLVIVLGVVAALALVGMGVAIGNGGGEPSGAAPVAEAREGNDVPAADVCLDATAAALAAERASEHMTTAAALSTGMDVYGAAQETYAAAEDMQDAADATIADPAMYGPTVEAAAEYEAAADDLMAANDDLAVGNFTSATQHLQDSTAHIERGTRLLGDAGEAAQVTSVAPC